jgi:hypothetical protein
MSKKLKVTVTPKKEDGPIEISPELFKEALGVNEEQGVRRREYIDGLANSAFEGATLGWGDEGRALVESMITGEEYEDIRDRYLTKKDKFDAANPGASMVAELVPALLTGVPIVKAGAKLAPKISSKTVVADKWLPKAPGIGATAGVEGAIYNAGSVDGGWDERVDAGFTGGTIGVLAGATLGKVVQAGQSRLARNAGDDLDDATYMDQTIKPGERVIYRTNNGELKRVEVVEEIDTTPKYENAPFLDIPQQGRVIVKMDNGTEFAVDRAKVEKINVTDFNKKAQEINYESQAKTFAENADPSFVGPRQNKLEIIEKFDNARGQNQNIKSWREAENAGELWDGIKKGVTDFYDDYISPASDMLMRRVSPQVGALFQRGDETALRTTVREAKAFYDPIDPVVKLEIKDPVFHAMVINYAAGNSLPKAQRVSQNDVVSYVRSALGEAEAKAVDRYLVYSRKKNQVNNSRVRGGKAQLDRLGNYLHTKLNPKKKPGKNTEELDDFDYLKDAADERRTRGFVTPEMADNYLPVFATDFRRIMNNERLLELAKKFDMPLPPPGTSAREFFQLFENWLVTRGVNREAAQQAKEVIAESMVGQTRSPMGWLQGANSLAYLGTLAGPKSAVLNIHDPLVTTANLGLKAGRNMFSSRGFRPRQSGIDQNVGEFMNTYNDILNMDGRSLERLFADTARNWTDIGMKASGFAAMDELGKMGTLNVVLQHAVDQARAGKLADSWGFYFSRDELKIIESALKKHGTDTEFYGKATDLIEELAFAGLGQQQLISGAGRPTGWARNPNMRPLWALRGFAIKQQALAMRNILGNIQDGNTAEAMKWLTRYALVAGGSYGLLNEARQWLMGDGEASITGVLMGMADQMVSLASLNTIGLNDYQYGRIMEDGIITTFIKGLEPIITARPRQFGEDVVKAMTDENTPASYPFTQFPIPKQVGNASTNIRENILAPLGITPGVDPLERVMKPITTEER